MVSLSLPRLSADVAGDKFVRNVFTALALLIPGALTIYVYYSDVFRLEIVHFLVMVVAFSSPFYFYGMTREMLLGTGTKGGTSYQFVTNVAFSTILWFFMAFAISLPFNYFFTGPLTQFIIWDVLIAMWGLMAVEVYRDRKPRSAHKAAVKSA